MNIFYFIILLLLVDFYSPTYHVNSTAATMTSSRMAAATDPMTIPAISPSLRLLSGSGGGGGIKAMNAELNPASSNVSLFA